MSLFTGQDEVQVHPLSQLVQIDDPPPPEASSALWEESELAQWAKTAEARWARKRRQPGEVISIESLQRLGELRGLALDIMSAQADHTGIRPAVLIRFPELYNQHTGIHIHFHRPDMPGIIQYFVPSLVDPNTPIPVDHLKVTEGPQHLGDELLAFLLWNLRHVMDGRLQVARCRECNAPFIIAPQKIQTGQKFCSKRCAAREGQRRRRAERKGGGVTLTQGDTTM